MKTVTSYGTRKLTKSNRLTMHRKVRLGKHTRYLKDIERKLYELGYWRKDDMWEDEEK